MALKTWLAHPLTQGLEIDDPHTTHLRRQIIQEKRFLRRIYEEWYEAIVTALPQGDGPVLELGSGAGFLSDFIPGLIASELFRCAGISAVLDGQILPFADSALRAIVMTDVLHHLPQVRRFFAQATRCVQTGGVIVMIEPWVTPWSRLVYTRLHHEPFRPDAIDWTCAGDGPLSGANGALPWIVFERDREQFEGEFPQLHIQSVDLIMPFRYLVSGGVSLRGLMPGWTFRLWRALEHALRPWARAWAMFARIVLVKK
ncbi:MAG: methyltransferase domain-containing protein [Anaerolineae bacterium]|nr:methyltransferase domain-containing protein [Anaerolineae bacterium]